MRVGIIITRIGGEDGVALETEKWIEVLHDLGHEIFLISGMYERNILERKYQELCGEFYLLSKKTLSEQKKAFLEPDENSIDVLDKVKKRSEVICDKIMKWIKKNNIEFLISENSSALPCNLSMTLGICKAVERTGVKTLTHDHDFYWERGNRYVSFHKEINNIIEKIIPLRLSNVRSVVINSAMKDVLEGKYGISNSVYIPNVIDFDKKLIFDDDLKKNFLEYFEFEEDSVILLQATRVVRRKGIETAVELVHKLNDKRVKLIITGSDKDEKTGDNYYEFLISLIKRLDLGNQVVFANGNFDRFSLWDFYRCADACTYFSKYEGFGNAFVEAVFMKKPIFVNNYKSAFWRDIGSLGFKLVMTENNNLTSKNISDVKKVLSDEKLREDIGEHNFKLGKKYFSYDVLREKLRELIN
ncbi:MAG: glycosyltransferase family 4 protein [Candidatus Pacearchaeota archaeon]|nr:glycosyltransferase family 4 protein [Candidatus Pacearchaeota archaeon]